MDIVGLGIGIKNNSSKADLFYAQQEHSDRKDDLNKAKKTIWFLNTITNC